MSAEPVRAAARLSCVGLNVGVPDRLLVRDLALDVPSGTVTAVLGCNGAGKTITLHTLAGLRPPLSGEIFIDSRRIGELRHRERARVLGLLTQTSEDAFPSTVLDTVLVGRHPHVGFWDWESDRDREIARAALAAVGMQDFAAREVSTLSGGERRRTAFAAILAQDPDIVLLDEPINHLDPHHQLEALHLMRTKAAQGRAIVMTLHDAGLAARFSHRALLLFGNGDWLYGASEDVLTETNIARLYGVPVRQVSWPEGSTFVIGV